MIRPTRIQLSRARGWRMPPHTVKVDRTTMWGNPYRAGVDCDHQHAVDCHRYLITFGIPARTAPHTDRDIIAYATAVFVCLPEITGKNLACWCAPDQPCHADNLLEIANRETRL
ncbi:DUF4326 domain-containing protein [Labrys neptuniae]